MAGAITLARHGQPALSREVRLSASEYRDWWGRYELGGLLERQSPPDDLVALARADTIVVTSTRIRAIESATLLTAGNAFASDDLYIEAPLPPPPWPEWIRIGPRLWGFFARFWWWWFNHHGDEESVREANARALVAAKRLVALASDGHDVLLVAHGFFNLMIGRALKTLGWRQTFGRGYKYWTVRRYERG